MSDSTTQITQIAASQAQKEVTANGLFDAASVAMAYGRRAEGCSGLYWGYYGTRFGGTLVPNGAQLLPASETTYMSVELATGAVHFSSEDSSSDSVWDDPAYGRCYVISTGASSVTSYQDHRFGPRGVADALARFGLQEQSGALDDIAALSASNDDIIQRKAGAWTNRTVAQYSSDLQGGGLTSGAVGFRTIPQNSQSTAYTTVAADSGKHLLHPSADTTARTFTIDSNANVAYPVGTAITFVNQNGAGTLTIAITSDTMRLAGAGTTGSRTLAANGVATALKVTSTEWIISGTGLT